MYTACARISGKNAMLQSLCIHLALMDLAISMHKCTFTGLQHTHTYTHTYTHTPAGKAT